MPTRNPGAGKASRFTGVFRSGAHKWKAQLQYKNQCLYLGTFATEEEAAVAYQREKTRIQAVEQGIQPPPPPLDINTVRETRHTQVNVKDDTPRLITRAAKPPERVLLLIPVARVAELRQSINSTF